MSLLGTLTPDNLIAGDAKLVTDEVTIVSSASLARGAVLGKITVGAATSAAKTGGNTGGGTLTLDSTTPILAGAVAGVYKVRCILIGTNAGKFEVVNPNGVALGLVDVGGTFANQIKFVLADSGTDFAVGDGFDVTLAAGSGKCKLIDKAAVDGSAEPYAVLAQASDASGGDVTHAPVYLSGEFSSAALSFAPGTVVADVLAKMRALSMYVKTIVTNP
jgi:hypothetical protein